ncbi:ribonuclease R [Spiroplasma endosymbiont of Labia minor]|uniref:ribonuclease R n=1 Tax=Spiroplasma endosymbiont of Labia minor TaxID=3066305 RepID=UPI0030D20D8E
MQNILELKKEKNIWSLNDIKNKTKLDFDVLKSKLDLLKSDNKLVISINNLVYFINDNLLYGTLKINERGFGFVYNDLNLEESFFVPPTSLNGCLTNDIVIYKKIKEDDGRFRAEILDLIKRDQETLVGIIVESKDKKFLDFSPSVSGYSSFRIVMINKKDFQLKKDLLLKVKILNVKERKLFVKIQKIIGDANKAYDRILSIAQELDIQTEFKAETLENSNKVATGINFNDPKIKKRLLNDLRNEIIVTIDGDDSKDLDDAISVKKTNNGFKLTVVIADVSYYVQPKSPLDLEALSRGNSTYLANVVLPMLPEKLSNGVCSLNYGEDKLAIACEINYDNDGKIVSKKVFETIIKSNARLTYKNVNNFFAGDRQIFAQNNEIANMLDVAFELHKILERKKIARGVISFEISEPKIILDAEFNVVDIKKRERGISEELIENFMVAANEAVAEIIFEKKLPFVYRNHDLPNNNLLNNWYAMIRNLGIDLKMTDAEISDVKMITTALKRISEQITDPAELEILNVALLRSMDKALYSRENIGHFGLASKCYTHFTSPIRRYSDLMVHRYLRQYIFENKIDSQKLSLNEKFIDKACLIINETEKKSVTCEREVNKVCMTEYTVQNIGKEYEGYISAVLKFGLFIQLFNLIEGLVHISTIPNNPVFDEKMNTIILDNNKQFKFGQKIKIRIKDASVKRRMIDFELI